MAIVCIGTGAATVAPGHAEGAADADAYVVSGQLDATGSEFSVAPATTPYTVDPLTACAAPLPSPLSAAAPSFVDVSGRESGACPSVTGGGSLMLAGCTSGTMTAAGWQLTEPTSGTVATFNGTGVVVGGVAVVAAPPALGDSYADDGATGAGALVGLLVPVGENGSIVPCPTHHLDVTALVAGVY